MDWLKFLRNSFFSLSDLVDLDSLLDEAALNYQSLARNEFNIEELAMVFEMNVDVRILHWSSEVIELRFIFNWFVKVCIIIGSF